MAALQAGWQVRKEAAETAGLLAEAVVKECGLGTPPWQALSAQHASLAVALQVCGAAASFRGVPVATAQFKTC